MKFPFSFFKSNRIKQELTAEDVFLDAHNLPQYNTHQYEGRLETRLTRKSALIITACFFLTMFIFTWKLGDLQIKKGEAFALQSENNRLNHQILYAERGIIYDRNGVELAWNLPDPDKDFSRRVYTATSGFSHVLGYVSYPKKDNNGVYYEKEYKGVEGVEEYFNTELSGINGRKIIETDALLNVQSENTATPAQHGKPLTLSIDSRVQGEMYNQIKGLAEKVDFKGGAGAIMDIHTGELIALTNYPEYSSSIMADREDSDRINEYFKDENTPFLNRVTKGLYVPGSIVKPFMALAALNEGVIGANHEILSTGRMLVPNPYNPSNPSIFTDWRAQGYVNIIDALAVSSNIFFYQVGGGYETQRGIGIDKINKYFKAFEIGEPTGIKGFAETEGTVPNPSWKEETFDGEAWRLGDTYLTSIGQYGFQVTPLQMLRGIASIARKGVLVTPTVKNKGEVGKDISIDIPETTYNIVEQGMREAVLRGTAKALDVPYMEIAGKTGTAEVGISKQRVNSWVVGFFPYKEPKYAFVIMMEKGPRTNLTGAAVAMRWLLDWMSIHTPEYIDSKKVSASPEVYMNSGTGLPEIELSQE